MIVGKQREDWFRKFEGKGWECTFFDIKIKVMTKKIIDLFHWWYCKVLVESFNINSEVNYVQISAELTFDTAF